MGKQKLTYKNLESTNLRRAGLNMALLQKMAGVPRRGTPRSFQRRHSNKLSKKWPILLPQINYISVLNFLNISSKFDCYYWFEPEWMLSRDSCL